MPVAEPVKTVASAKKEAQSSSQQAQDADVPLPIPNLDLPRIAYRLAIQSSSLDKGTRDKLTAELLKGIEEDEMASYYEFLETIQVPASPGSSSTSSLLPSNPKLLERLKKANEKKLHELAEQQRKAEEEEGETEVNLVLRERASYLAKIGDKDGALTAHKVAISKAAGLGSRLDLTLAQIRIGLFHADAQVTLAAIAKAKELVDSGGDWDRRNRLKVYEGVYLLSVRSFSEACSLLLEALPTFTATEVVDYETFVLLTVLAGVKCLNRKDLKKMIIESPEVRSVIDDLPHLKSFVNSLYNCQYSLFFQSLAEIEQSYLLPSRLLGPHTRFYTRECRIVAYAQLLESYRSVTLENIARAFGVSVEFIDEELSRFISAGRLPAVIDKVHGIVETRRPDAKNAQYGRIIKEGDVLLNSLQKLSRTAL